MDAVNDSFDLMEKRIDSLNRVIGPIPDNAETKGSENFVDSITSANTLVTSAVIGREEIKKVVDRSEELENYLDPNFVENSQQVRSKEVYLNAIGPELETTFAQLAQIKSLQGTLGAEYFRNIPDCSDKLKEITEKNEDFEKQTEMIEETLILAMKRYGEIQSGLVESFASINKRLQDIEKSLEEKRQFYNEIEMMIGPSLSHENVLGEPPNDDSTANDEPSTSAVSK